jgi:hypothetical protein
MLLVRAAAKLVVKVTIRLKVSKLIQAAAAKPRPSQPQLLPLIERPGWFCLLAVLLGCSGKATLLGWQRGGINCGGDVTTRFRETVDTGSQGGTIRLETVGVWL